jgi:polygalacturonase
MVGCFKIVVVVALFSFLILSLGVEREGPRKFGSGITEQYVALAQRTGVINVKAFGARGDGVSDETAAIQAAINAAPNGSTISFPRGTYNVANFIVKNRSGLSFVGEGRNSTIRQQTGAERIATFTSSRNIAISNLAFDANGKPSYGGVAFYEVTSVLIERNFFYDGAPKPIGRTDRYSFVFARGQEPSRDIRILNNEIEDLALEVDHSQRVTIDGNNVKRPVRTTGIGIFTINDGAVAQDFQITNNTMVDPLGSGFAVSIDPPYNQNCVFRRITISNNRLIQGKNQSYGIRIGTGDSSRVAPGNVFEDIAIKNNYIRIEATAPGPSALIFANSSPRAGIVFDRLVVTGNTIEGNGSSNHGYALDLRQIKHSLVANNTLRGVVHGISVGGGALNNQIRNNEVEASEVAYSFGGSLGGNRVTNNRIAGNPRQGWDLSKLHSSDLVQQ